MCDRPACAPGNAENYRRSANQQPSVSSSVADHLPRMHEQVILVPQKLLAAMLFTSAMSPHPRPRC